MKKYFQRLINLKLMLLVAISVYSCCFFWHDQGELQNTYTLSEEAKNLLAYSEEGFIRLKHSEGFEFQMHVQPDQGYYNNKFDGECQDYDRFEFVNATLSTEIPLTKLRFSVIQPDPNFEFEIEPNLAISELRPGQANSNVLQFFIPDFDQELSLEIEGITYNNVTEYLSQDPEYYISKIYYNTSNGFIQMNYLNGEYVQLQP